MHIYKFIPFEKTRIDSLIDNKIYLCAPSRFNDLNDCIVKKVHRSDESTRQLDIIKKLLDIVSKDDGSDHFLPKDIRDIAIEYILSTNPEDKQTLRIVSLIQKLNKFLRDRSGVACFIGEASVRKNALMWAHYADNHNGICVEYKCNKTSFRHLSPVTYSSRSIVPTVKELLFTPEEIFTRILTTKSNEWIYEDEWRIIGVNCLKGDEIGEGKLIDLPTGITPKRIITGNRLKDNANLDEIKKTLEESLNISTVKYNNFISE